MLSCIFMLISGVLKSQTDLYDFQTRTHMVSPDEMKMLSESGKGFVPTTPPGGKVRSIAEWEPSEGVIVGYSGQFGIPFTLISQMAQVAKVYTIVASASAENTVRNQYIANGIDTSNCVFVRGSLNSYWTRDYSPWFIADSAHNVAIVDFPYNRPRPDDDDVPALFANEFGIAMYGMNIKHTGGNYMSDGMGRAASTKLVITENTNLTAVQINNYMYDYLGIDKYYTIDDPMDDYIEHIDCWGKFLAPDKILLGKVPSNDPRFQDYEAIASFFATENSSYGKPYKVYRVYSPNGQPYTNSYILNNKVFVPLVTTNGTPWNDSALNAYQQAMPGYDVVGVYALSGKPWASSDALHCRVHEIPDRGMLYIKHYPLSGDVGQKNSYEIRAEIIPYSKAPLINDSICIRFRYNNGPWHKVLMTKDTGFVWVGMIPDSAINVEISYSIYASDLSIRRESHPYTGIADPHVFTVKSSVGIAQPIRSERDVLVFPNPCDDRLYAAISNPTGSSADVRVYSVTGVLIMQITLPDAQSLFREGIRMSSVDNGIYLIEITTGSKRYFKKIMVVHP